MSDDLQFPPPPPTDDPTAVHLYGCLRIMDMKQDQAMGRIKGVEIDMRKAKEDIVKLERRSGVDRRSVIKIGLGGTGLGAALASVWHWVKHL